MQRIFLGVVALAAVVGWVLAFLGMSGSSVLKDRLAAAEAELSEVSALLTDTRSRLTLTQGAAASLEGIEERVAVRQAEAATLDAEIAAKKRELETLRQDLKSGKIELGTLADRIEASKAVLSRLTQDQEEVEAELGRLRAETERQRGAVISSPAKTQTAAQAPKAPPVPITAPATIEATTAVATPVVNPLADATRRFARIDQDGDGRFDRLDFRLKRVSLFGLVDANGDGYLTLDETLLSPEAFQNFDSDADGKISRLEMADRRSFSVIDTDRDDFVTFEEYLNFLRISPE